MLLEVRPQIAAHIPAENGYSPLGGDYGDARIVSRPSSVKGSFATIDAAVDAAKIHTDTYDSATGVFQAGKGAFQIGQALLWDSDDGPSELALSQSQADKVVFDDPTLQAIVSYNSIARRPS